MSEKEDLANLYRLIYYHNATNDMDFWAFKVGACGLDINLMKQKYFDWLRPNKIKLFIDGRINKYEKSKVKDAPDILEELMLVRNKLRDEGIIPNEEYISKATVDNF